MYYYSRDRMIQAMRNGVFDEQLEDIEREVRNRKRQIELNKRRDAFEATVRKWEEDKAKPHKRVFVGGIVGTDEEAE